MRILFFAHLKNVARCASAEIKFGCEIDAKTLWQRLLTDYPELINYQSTVRLARNGHFAVTGIRFTDTDEVALIPPVSGG